MTDAAIDKPGTGKELPPAKVARLKQLKADCEAAVEAYDREFANTLLDEGYSVTALARAMGVSVPAIRQRRDRIRLRIAESRVAA